MSRGSAVHLESSLQSIRPVPVVDCHPSASLLSGSDRSQKQNELARSEEQLFSFKEGYVKQRKLFCSELFLSISIQKCSVLG